MFRGRNLTAAVAAPVLAVLLAVSSTACGGADDASSEAATQGASQESDKTDVRAVFDRYRTALGEHDGQAATELVTKATIEYYDELAVLATSAGPEEIGERRAADRMNVAMLRQQLSEEETSNLDGAALFDVAVRKGVVDKSSVSGLELTEITVSGDQAAAKTESDGEERPIPLTFARENNTWRIDLMPVIEVTDKVLAELSERRDVTEDDLIFQMVSASTGTTVDESIFAKP